MTGRNIAYGVLGWAVPGIVALPLALLRESSGGESALVAVLAWWGLGVIGCSVAGAAVGAGGKGPGTVAQAFWAGLGGVATSWVAALAVSVVIEAVVQVLHLGAVSFLLPIPLVVGYVVGFAVGAIFLRP
jgi:hypothetical protein